LARAAEGLGGADGPDSLLREARAAAAGGWKTAGEARPE